MGLKHGNNLATIIANGAKGRALQLAPVHMLECVVVVPEFGRTVHMHAVDEGQVRKSNMWLGQVAGDAPLDIAVL